MYFLFNFHTALSLLLVLSYDGLVLVWDPMPAWLWKQNSQRLNPELYSITPEWNQNFNDVIFYKKHSDNNRNNNNGNQAT